jgi:hypothetical protein
MHNPASAPPPPGPFAICTRSFEARDRLFSGDTHVFIRLGPAFEVQCMDRPPWPPCTVLVSIGTYDQAGGVIFCL